MKTKVFILAPYDVPPAEFTRFAHDRLEPHRFDADDPTSRPGRRFDYAVGAADRSFDDPAAERRLPVGERAAWAGNVCDKACLPPDVVPGAVVTPDGQWHDLSDFGWRMTAEPGPDNDAALARWTAHYRTVMNAMPDGWVLAVWVHS